MCGDQCIIRCKHNFTAAHALKALYLMLEFSDSILDILAAKNIYLSVSILEWSSATANHFKIASDKTTLVNSSMRSMTPMRNVSTRRKRSSRSWPNPIGSV